MNIVITGASGFLGRELVEQLKAQTKYTVYALTSQVDALKKIVDGHSNIVVCDKDFLQNPTVGFGAEDVLINCAFPRTLDDFDMSGGLDYIQATLQAAVEAGIGAVINISSQSVYDANRSSAAQETDYPILQSKYAVGKYATELLVKTLGKGVCYTNIRMASLIGPGFDQRLTNKMAAYAIQKQSITAETGNQYYGFLDIEDAARGILKLLEIPAGEWKNVYNLGSDRSYSLMEIAGTIAKLLKEEWNLPIEVTEKASDRVFCSALNNEQLKAEIGEYQKNTLEDTMRKIIAMKMQ